MKLIYRGVQYQGRERTSPTLKVSTAAKRIIYRGNSTKASISPKFPWWKYFKQLWDKSGSKPILDPIKLWYEHKREFIAECWHLDELEKLDRMWNLTLQIEKSKVLQPQPQQKTKLKYRGVTYYR